MSLPLELKTFLVDCSILPNPLPMLSARGMKRAIPRETQGWALGYTEGGVGTWGGWDQPPSIAANEAESGYSDQQCITEEKKMVNREYIQPELCGWERQGLPPALPW